MINAQISPKPKSAPAFVDCTKCETPIAAPANNNPGPSFFNMELISPITFSKLCGVFSAKTTIFTFLV